MADEGQGNTCDARPLSAVVPIVEPVRPQNEKFRSTTRFELAKLRHRALRSVLRPLATWQPMDEPMEGYSLVIGCASSMLKVLEANLVMLRRQNRTNLKEIILAFDVTRNGIDRSYEDELRARFSDLPLRTVYYTRYQAAVLHTIGWAWCYCWMNWVLGIAACRTRYALLHDLDALLLREDVLEDRYRLIQTEGARFLSVGFYRGNGITPQDNLAVTFEMIFDATWLRERFRPIDLFNRVSRLDGRRLEFDTFLYPQHAAQHSAVVPLQETDMVHPSQLVCQFVELQHRRGYVPPAANNLPLLPYFHYLAGQAEALDIQRDRMDQATGTVVPLQGFPMDVRRMSLRHWEWLVKQVGRVETVVAGQMRPEVRAYFESLRRLVERGSARRVNVNNPTDGEVHPLGGSTH